MDDPCRRISPQFLVDVLTVPKLRQEIVRRHVRLRGVRVNGTIDLSDAEITSEVRIDTSRIEGSVILNGSHWDRFLSLEGSTVDGDFSGTGMHTESHVLLHNGAVIKGKVDLFDAKIGGDLNMQASSFAGTVNADSLSVARNLLMRYGATFEGGVNLIAAKVGGNLEMNGSSFAGVYAPFLSVGLNLFMGHATFRGDVDLDGVKIGGDLRMQDSSRFDGNVILMAAKIGGTLEMNGSSFAKVTADRLNVAGNLLMRDASFSDALDLTVANIRGNLEMDRSSFAGAVWADTLTIGANLFMRDRALFSDQVTLIGAKVGGNLHLGGSTAWRIDLSGVNARELPLSGLRWWCPRGNVIAEGAEGGASAAPVPWPLGDAGWRHVQCNGTDRATLPTLVLRNAHVDAFQDSADAWPPSMDLEGFHYDRLGGIGRAERNDMRQRSPEEWKDWLERDPIFSTQPYTQLSSVLLVAGHRDTAEAIQFAGRERARSEAGAHNGLLSWLWPTALFLIAGYGIGDYTFRVLWWVLGLTVLGFVFLYLSPNARTHSVVWRLGASLHRLLPIVKLSKEFEDFFDNPATNADWPRNLNPILVGYFAFHAIFGWVLGLILLAAMGGLTQKG